MKSQQLSVSYSVAVIVIATSARIVQNSLLPYEPMPSVMHNPSEVTSQYDPPETIDQFGEGGSGDGDGCGSVSDASVPLTIRAKTMTCASRGAERRHVD
jgi:hypothetical protein